MKRVDHGSAWSPCSEILRFMFVRSEKSITSQQATSANSRAAWKARLSGDGQFKQDGNETRSLHQFLSRSGAAKATFPAPQPTNSKAAAVSLPVSKTFFRVVPVSTCDCPGKETACVQKETACVQKETACVQLVPLFVLFWQTAGRRHMESVVVQCGVRTGICRRICET